MTVKLNHRTELLRYLKELLESDDFVNTVTKGSLSKLDLNKMDIPPIAHVYVNGADFGNGQTVTMDVELTVVSVVYVNPEINKDKFWGNDNEDDVLNDCLAVLNRAYSRLLRDFEDKDITAVQNATATEVTYNKDLLIGWSLPFQVIMPNTTISLCQ